MELIYLPFVLFWYKIEMQKFFSEKKNEKDLFKKGGQIVDSIEIRLVKKNIKMMKNLILSGVHQN